MIPFTQYLRPDGRRRETGLKHELEIEDLAQAFINAGGWFECEVLTTFVRTGPVSKTQSRSWSAARSNA